LTRTLLALGLVLALGQAVCADRPAAETRPAPRGLYLLIGTGKETRARLRDEPSFVGVSLRVKWKSLQPSRDQLSWEYFDREIGLAREAGKSVMLRVMPGVHSPGWLYDEGAQTYVFTLSNPHRNDRGSKKTIPVPWDPVFLENWTRFVGLMGERYSGNPDVHAVHLVGPAAHSAEMHLPKSPKDQENWRRKGYTTGKLVGAWKRCIDAYADAFPDTPLVLNVSSAIFQEDGAVEGILAYAKQRVGGRLCLQHNALHARTKVDFRTHRLVSSSRESSVVGFQFVSPAANRKRFRGTLAEAFEIGIDAGATYFEVYPSDLKDPASRAAIEKTSRRLRAPSGDAAAPQPDR